VRNSNNLANLMKKIAGEMYLKSSCNDASSDSEEKPDFACLIFELVLGIFFSEEKLAFKGDFFIRSDFCSTGGRCNKGDLPLLDAWSVISIDVGLICQ
jgi:hypothetical protein